MAKELPGRTRWVSGCESAQRCNSRSERHTRRGAGTLAALMILGSSTAVCQAQLHIPTFQCTSNGAVRVTCVGTFLDGRSAAGIKVRVFDKHDHVVYVGTVDSQGRITFRKPDAEFHIVFDAGQGNVLTILASDMT